MAKIKREQKPKYDIIVDAARNLAEGGWSSFHSVMCDLYDLDPNNRWFESNDEFEVCDYCGENEDDLLLRDGDYICPECKTEEESE